MGKCLHSSIFLKRLQYNYSSFRPFWKQRNEGQKLFYDKAYMYYSTCRWLFCFLVDYFYIIHDFSFRFESEKGKKQFF